MKHELHPLSRSLTQAPASDTISSRMIGVDLFAGAGGMSLGAQMAGIDVRLAVEYDKCAAATYTHNHPNTTVLCDDVANVAAIDIPSNGDGTILFGGPPCQGFSTSNQRTRDSFNTSNWLFMHFIRLVDQWKPDWVLFENVKGIAETEHGAFLDCVIRSLEDSEYTVTSMVLNAVDFGVPQKRNRQFVVGSCHGIRLERPSSTASDPITVAEALLEDLPVLCNGASIDRLSYRAGAVSLYSQSMRSVLQQSSNHLVTNNAPHIIKRYEFVPQGGNWENIPERLMKNYKDRTRCHTGIYHRLRSDAPSVVVGNFRKNMLIHPTQNRGLSVREAARLQSFPDSYEFKGSIGFQQQQVGNAVPPLLAKAVFSAIQRAHQS